MRTDKPSLPIALTVAGSDSGGGAGIQADLKTFHVVGVHGTTVITCLTAQNPRRVLAIKAVAPVMVRRQIEAVCEELTPHAAKTGMLYSESIIRAVVDAFREAKGKWPLVVDPVMVATSGARLLRNGAVKAMLNHLLPQAMLVTPNVDEAQILAERPIGDVEDLRAAARILHDRFGCAALVKGGHLSGMKEAVDVLFDGDDEWLLTAPRVRGISTHGTGCTYSAAVTAYLAQGLNLADAVSRAKEYVSAAIARACRVRRHHVLGTNGRLGAAR